MDVYQRRRLVALSVVAGLFIIFVLLVRSCGDDDEGGEPLSGTTGPGTATSQSKPAFIDSADAICLETNTVLAGIDESSANAAAEEAEAIGSQLAQLQTLLPPEDGADDLDRFLAALERQAQTLDRRAVAVERDDAAAADQLAAQADEREARAARAARKFGFEVCGNLDEVAERTGEDRDDDAVDEEAPVAPPVTTTPTEPTTEPTTEPPATTPPADTGAEGGVGTTPPTGTDNGTDNGTDDSSSGGISP